MDSTNLAVLTLVAALGSGLIAGVFFAFSSFVMRALGQQLPAAGIATMQAINVTVLNAWFLGAFLGTGLVCLGLVGLVLADRTAPGAGWRLVGAALYLLGTVGVTIVGNVPRNEQLAALDPAAADAAIWTRYLSEWTQLNTIRTVTALLAAACFTLALMATASD